MMHPVSGPASPALPGLLHILHTAPPRGVKRSHLELKSCGVCEQICENVVLLVKFYKTLQTSVPERVCATLGKECQQCSKLHENATQNGQTRNTGVKVFVKVPAEASI